MSPNKILTTLLSLALLIGIGFTGYYFYQQKNVSEPVAGPSEELTFYLPERDMPGEREDTNDTDQKAEDLFSVEGRKVNIVHYNLPFRVFMKQNNIINDKVDTGMMDVPQLAFLNREGAKLRPVFAVSPDRESSCHSEMQIITTKKSGLKSMADLKNKKLVITERAMRSVNMLTATFEKENLSFDTLYIKRKIPWAKENLLSGTVDAIVITVSKLGNGQTISRFGSFDGNNYEKEPEMQVIYTTDTKIPCRVIFVNEKLAPETQKAFITKLLSLTNDADSRITLRQLAMIGGLTTLTSEDWSVITKTLGEATADKGFVKFAKTIEDDQGSDE